MSIKSVVGNITHSVENTVDTVKTYATSIGTNILGSATTGLSTIWSGGFTGMSRTEFETLLTELETYVSGLETKLDESCNTCKADVEKAYKGTEVETAVTAYIEAERELFKAYVSSIRKQIEEAAEAYRNFTAGEQSVAADVTEAEGTIKSQAEGMQIDTGDVNKSLDSGN